MAGVGFLMVTSLLLLSLIGHDFLLVYYRIKCKANYCNKAFITHGSCKMSSQIGPLLHLGSKCYYGWDLYYAWVQMLLQLRPLLHCAVTTLVPSTFVRGGLSLPYFADFFEKFSLKMADSQYKILKGSMYYSRKCW